MAACLLVFIIYSFIISLLGTHIYVYAPLYNWYISPRSSMRVMTCSLYFSLQVNLSIKYLSLINTFIILLSLVSIIVLPGLQAVFRLRHFHRRISALCVASEDDPLKQQRGTPPLSHEPSANSRTAPEFPEQNSVNRSKQTANYRTSQEQENRKHLKNSKQNYRAAVYLLSSHSATSFPSLSCEVSGSCSP